VGKWRIGRRGGHRDLTAPAAFDRFEIDLIRSMKVISGVFRTMPSVSSSIDLTFVSERLWRGLPVLAIGQRARGVIAIGVNARGIVAIGVVAQGVVPIGVLSFGLISIGVLSVGLLVGLGVYAIGPLTLGVNAFGILAGGVEATGWKVLFSVG